MPSAAAAAPEEHRAPVPAAEQRKLKPRDSSPASPSRPSREAPERERSGTSALTGGSRRRSRSRSRSRGYGGRDRRSCQTSHGGADESRSGRGGRIREFGDDHRAREHRSATEASGMRDRHETPRSDRAHRSRSREARSGRTEAARGAGRAQEHPPLQRRGHHQHHHGDGGGVGPLVTGTVKSYSRASNFGFITSPEILSRYGRDVYFTGGIPGGIFVGSRVSFHIKEVADQPQARNIQPAQEDGHSALLAFGPKADDYGHQPIHYPGGDPLAKLAASSPQESTPVQQTKRRRKPEGVLGLAEPTGYGQASLGSVTLLKSTASAAAQMPPEAEWICEVCMRKFSSEEALTRHEQFSDLHKQNLDAQRRRR
eukprot:TRINITY_DN6504_c1_g1_i1.p1 TRINITY_DN6504_c1_g1~~TRINITY_DN6504_c1_g1_i1.p1  ORF type:complete len:370 (+),score=55.75 TRINITY_DN6504_c1_g1_i1:344-1453(+)